MDLDNPTCLAISETKPPVGCRRVHAVSHSQSRFESEASGILIVMEGYRRSGKRDQ